MNKLFFILFLLIPLTANASPIVYGTTYATNGTVTSVNLNGNFSNVSSVVNGGLDNTNANTTSGYRFYQTVAVLPSPGNQGAVYFLTSDNTLNFDNGGAFIKSVAISGTPAQGDVIYYNGVNWVNLPAGINGQALLTQGTGANPHYSPLNLSSSSNVTSILPVLNGGTGSSTQNFVDLSNTQTIAGVKTFSSTIKSSVNMNGGSIINGSLGQTSTGNHNMSNGETYDVPSGCYMSGVKRGGAGEIDQVRYSCP